MRGRDKGYGGAGDSESSKAWPKDDGYCLGDRSGTINNKNDRNALSLGIG